ncbi:hypothetical protein HRD49_13785 [Corallococcus exiguus]|uniref:hypothetical protein n=1 Tax=Corallococcus TaxID=83461 RepID=UPI000EC03DA4|nr:MULTISPECIES: hypothetical protein [Corallococcus]NNC21196.1 hypothetical protein [Corallococcus exiguus]NRD62819.1 hypothetical protein [Corallococcus exiguus]RKI09990.1 hypothetical protein D7Y15_22795 [Corallococcus sp. AB030]
MDMRWKNRGSLIRNALGLGLGVGLLFAATPGIAGDTTGKGCAWFDGVESCPIDASKLSATNEGLLVESTDGKQSGVSLHLEGATGWDAWLNPLEPDGSSRMLLTFIGAQPDGTSELLERVVVARSKAEGQGAIYVDPSVHGASTYTVRGYVDGKLAFERFGVAPVPESFGGPAGPGDDAKFSRLVAFPGKWGSGHGVVAGPNGEGCTPGLDFPFPKPVRFPDHTFSVAVDLVTFRPEGVQSNSHALREVSLQGVGLQSFTLQKVARTP